MKLSAVAAFATSVAACQLVTGLHDLNEVDCLVCDGGAPDATTDTSDMPPCAHTFCASFDQDMLITGWQSLAQSPGTTIQLDTQEVKSPPASLLVALAPTDGGTTAATLSQTFQQTAHSAHVELDLRVEPGTPQPFDAGITDAGTDADGGDAAAPDSGTDLDTVRAGRSYRILTMAPGDSVTRVGIALAYSDDGPVILVAGADGREILLPLDHGPTAATWAHVVIDTTLDAAGAGSVKVTLDGAVVLDRSGLVVGGAGAPVTQLELGLVVRDHTRSFSVRCDNLTLDLQ